MDLWKHRTYLDLWSLVHLLSGALLSIGAYGLGFSVMQAFVLASALLILWEALEWLVGISERPANILLDIVIGMAGFTLAAYWHYVLLAPFDPILTLLVAIPAGLIALWGFVDMRLYGYR